MCSPHRWTHTDTPHMPTAHTCLMLTHACTSNIYHPHTPAAQQAYCQYLPISHTCMHPHMHVSHTWMHPHTCVHPTYAYTPHMHAPHTPHRTENLLLHYLGVFTFPSQEFHLILDDAPTSFPWEVQCSSKRQGEGL